MDNDDSAVSSAAPPPAGETVRLDAVCGMVVGRDAPHRVEHDGKTYLFCSDGCAETFRASPESYLEPSPAAGEVDPVCGMSVAPDSPHRLEHGGTTYRFCCAGCAERFGADPERYLEGRPEEPAAPGAEYTCPMHPEVVQEGPGSCPDCGMGLEPMMPAAGRTRWTCPMHPEIVRDEPGDCPKCGMALEPTTVSAEEENPELVDMTRRFWIGLALTVPLFVLAMSDLIPGQPLAGRLSTGASNWIQAESSIGTM